MIKEKWVAINQALKENVFALIVCISNKIPVLLCGTPGCSKTLSIQLISTNMKGKNSNDPIFQILPKIDVFNF